MPSKSKTCFDCSKALQNYPCSWYTFSPLPVKGFWYTVYLCVISVSEIFQISELCFPVLCKTWFMYICEISEQKSTQSRNDNLWVLLYVCVCSSLTGNFQSFFLFCCIKAVVFFFLVKSCLIHCFFLLRCLISCSFFSGFALAFAPEKLTRAKAVAPAKSATGLPLTSVETGLLAGCFSTLN